MQQNFQTILKSIPNGNDFRVTANGKIVPAPSLMGAWSRGPPIATNGDDADNDKDEQGGNK